MADKILANEFRALSKERWVHVELEKDNIFCWDVALMVLNPDSLYYGGYFKAKMNFPKSYPFQPPDFRFKRSLFHPNIYKDGRLCISILHAPGDDEMSGESAAERWSPAQRVESVLLSILSLLDDAECSSPANVDAGVMLRSQPKEYKEMVKRDVTASKADVPEGFTIPKHDIPPPKQDKHEERDFWYDSDEEEDFGGSDTDEEMQADGDEESDEDQDEELQDEELADEDDENHATED